MDLYTIGCTIKPAFIWYIQKCMLIWKVCFYFCLVFAICLSKMKTRYVTRNLFTEKVLSRWDNFNSCDPLTYTTRKGRKWLSAYRSKKLRSKFRITKMQRSESSIIVCERIVRAEIVQAPEHLFSGWVTRNMARLHFWRTNSEDKTKIKRKFPYQHTLLNIPNERGFNCSSDGV